MIKLSEFSKRKVYAIQLDVDFSTTTGKYSSGGGRTFAFSSDAMVIRSSMVPAISSFVKVRVAWPFCLETGVALQLIVDGRVCEVDKEEFAIKFMKHEFRTRFQDRKERTA